MKKVLGYLKPHVPKMTIGISIKFVGAIMDLLLPWALSYVLDNVVPQKSVKMVFFWGGLMCIFSITALVTNIIANRMAALVAQQTTKALRHDLFAKISYLSARQIDTFTIPSLESRLTSDTYNVHQMVSMMQRMGIRAPILLIGGIVITLTLEPVLTLVLLGTLPFLTVIVMSVSKRGIPLYTQLQKSVDTMVRTMRENFTGIRVIKALSRGDFERTRFDKVNGQVVKNEKKAAMTMAVTSPVMNVLLNIGLTMVIAIGAFRVNSGLTQPGAIIAFLTYFTIILNSMLAITRMFVMLSKATASAGRIEEVLSAPEDLTVTDEKPVETPYHIEFKDVSFSYNKRAEREKQDIEHITFNLKRGETLGIMGATGCGKSTILQLLLRFYDPDSGEIRINGRSVSSIPPGELYGKFGIAFQNDVLFANTIQENIAFGRDISKEAVEEAAAVAQAKWFIDQLEESYEYSLDSKGANLSGGQKQRLLIARAVVSHPEILILDDSSSALDYATDASLRTALSEKFSDTTAIIVAQRVSSIRSAHCILVLEDGEILGRGTHEELMESCPAYREVAISQMGNEEVIKNA